MAAAYRGRPQQNAAAGLVNEYLERRDLAALGFTFPIESLTAEKADALLFVDREVKRLQAADAEKERKRRQLKTPRR